VSLLRRGSCLLTVPPKMTGTKKMHTAVSIEVAVEVHGVSSQEGEA